MANSKKRSRSKTKSYRNSYRRKHSNPFGGKKMRSYRRRGHGRNPSIGGFSGNELLKLALGAAAGSIGTRFVTQAILGDKNSGMTGYAASAATAVALAWAAAKFLGQDIAKGVAAGGLSAIVIRVWQERVSGTSPAALSGYLGDLDFSSDGLGAYINSGFPLPTVSSQNGNYLSVPTAGPQLVTAAQASSAPAVATQPAVPSGLARFGARF